MPTTTPATSPPRAAAGPRIPRALLEADAEALLHLQHNIGRTDWRTITVLVTVAICLSLQNYLFTSENIHFIPGLLTALGLDRAAETFRAAALSGDNYEIARLSYWAIGRLITYVLIPLLVIRLLLREPVRNFGVTFRGCLRSLPIYLAMFALIFPAVWYFSRTPSFQESYPFYELSTGESLWPRFWIWQLLYASQFVALEFFFRGFLLHGTRHRAGSMAIFIMMVPYCMLHFEKPMPETLGAIGAGVILGYMSLKTRSIWLGACLHIAVAMSMDFLSLGRKGLL